MSVSDRPWQFLHRLASIVVLQHTTINLQSVNFLPAFAMIGIIDMTNEICVPEHCNKRLWGQR
jgi:hypothetical protein